LGKQKTKSAWSGFEQRRSRWPEGRSTGMCFVKKGAAALPLHDIPVIAALTHPWMLPPLSNWARANLRIKIKTIA
jgi:hypothetical protein